jgi:acetyl-CoA carboxylase biotin carboxyl carrier protein
LEVQRGDNRVRIRTSQGGSQEPAHAPAMPVNAEALSATPAPAGESKVRQLGVPVQEERNEIVKSPIVGTYYDSPVPGEAPFVTVGQRIEPKQVLCIIESMKLMNEIESEVAGIVLAKHIENGRPVEYGESLFTIQPV